jgi:uncharacterized protein
MRLVVVLAVVVLLVLMVRQLWRRPPRVQRRTAPAVQRMVRCAQCGVFVPRAHAIEVRGDYYCSAEHADAAQR